MANGAITAILILVLTTFSVTEILAQTNDKLECLTNDECPTNNVCSQEQCIDPCHHNICGRNAQCHVANHTAVCTCLMKYIGDPATSCLPAVVSDCQGNLDCHSTEVCFNGKCLNPCKFVTCGLHTVCHSTNHSAACTCPIGTTWDPIVGCKRLENSAKIKKFKLFQDIGRTWQQALNHCNSVGMKLATINSQEEQDEIQKQTRTIEDYSAWLGGSDLGDTGNYTWRSTNTAITYTNWLPGQPDNYKYINGNMDHCIVISSYIGLWMDMPCHYHYYYPVCEYYD